MPSDQDIVVIPIGDVESSLTDPTTAPRQPDEGAPPASIVLDPAVQAAASGIAPGDRLTVLTWLHEADRSVLAVHP
jgi:tRNA (Thr-GGU) A37 N-methylase